MRYAVIGAGNITQVAVLPAFAHARENSELVALLSSDPEKRAALRQRYDLEFDGDYAELEAVLERGKIDAVYIATPNSLHKEFALRAAQRGVHVLCEKPLAPSVSDCRAMAEACEQNDVKLMVAYRLHFEEANLTAMDIARSGKLGNLRLFSSFFSHVVRADDIRRDAELGGGALYDLGVYCINAARNLFSAEPIGVLASSIERDGTDDTTSVILKFPGERLAQFCISNSAADVSSYRVAGDRGELRVEPGYEYAAANVHHLTIDEKSETREFGKRDQFAPELGYFSDCILRNVEPEPSVEEGICDVRVIEAIRASIKSGATVRLAPYRRERRPSLSQERHEPPVSKPDTLHAPSPSER